jgi:ankyrin repeat protein
MSKSKKTDELFAAINNGNIALVEQLIRDGADLNVTDGDIGYTSLKRAFASNKQSEKKCELIKILLNNGASIDATANFSKATVLHKAVRAEDIAVLTCLIENGPASERPHKLNVARTEANRLKNNAMIKFLEAKAAELMVVPAGPNLIIENNTTSVDNHETVFPKKIILQIDEPILSSALIPQIVTNTESKPTKIVPQISEPLNGFTTQRGSKSGAVSKAVEKINKAIAPQDYSFCDALTEEDFPLAQSFLKSGDIVNGFDRFGINFLARAIQHNKLNIVEFLLKNDALISKKQMNFLLHRAYDFDKLELLTILLEKGADINTLDIIYGSTCLDSAVRNEKWGQIKFLLEKGAYLNKNHESALMHIAISQELMSNLVYGHIRCSS